MSSKLVYDQECLICDETLVREPEDGLKKEKIPPVSINSGAGHDALAMAALCPVAMLFVRCKNGLSHHPDETVDIKRTRLLAKESRNDSSEISFNT